MGVQLETSCALVDDWTPQGVAIPLWKTAGSEGPKMLQEKE